LADGFIIHIGDVAHMLNRSAVDLEYSTQGVLQEKGSKIADVGGSINRGTAAVEAQRVALLGCERL
jgi:hypothetical protein